MGDLIGHIFDIRTRLDRSVELPLELLVFEEPNMDWSYSTANLLDGDQYSAPLSPELIQGLNDGSRTYSLDTVPTDKGCLRLSRIRINQT